MFKIQILRGYTTMSLAVDFLTNPSCASFVQNSAAQVLSEGCLKAIGRPAFTLADKTAPVEERKYSATKEFLYQSLSMGAYFSLIFPIKNNSYKLLRGFKQFKDLEPIKAKTGKEFREKMKNFDNEVLKTKIKGANELAVILLSGVILTMVTPKIATKIVHPIMDKMNKSDNKLDEEA